MEESSVELRLQTAKAKRQTPSQLNSLTHRLCLNTGHYTGLDKISRCAHLGDQACVWEYGSELCFHWWWIVSSPVGQFSGKIGTSMSGLHRANPHFLGTCEAPILAKARPSSINEGKSVLFNTWSYFWSLECSPHCWDARIRHQTLMFPLLVQTLNHSRKKTITFISSATFYPTNKTGIVIVIPVSNYSQGEDYVAQFSQDSNSTFQNTVQPSSQASSILTSQLLNAKIILTGAAHGALINDQRVCVC